MLFFIRKTSGGGGGGGSVSDAFDQVGSADGAGDVVLAGGEQMRSSEHIHPTYFQAWGPFQSTTLLPCTGGVSLSTVSTLCTWA